MDQQPSWRDWVVRQPLPVYFLFTSVLFGVVIYLQNRYAIIEPQSSVRQAIIEGIIGGGLITASIWYLRRRFQKAAQNGPRTEQEYILEDSVRRGMLPTDPKLKKMLPAYIDRSLSQSLRTKSYIPIEFGALTMFVVMLAITNHNKVWFLYAIFLAGVGYNRFRVSQRRIKTLQTLRGRLKS